MSRKTDADGKHMFTYGDDPEEGGWAASQRVIRTQAEAQLGQQMAPRPASVVVGGGSGKPKLIIAPLCITYLLSTPSLTIISPTHSFSLCLSGPTKGPDGHVRRSDQNRFPSKINSFTELG